MNKKHESFHTGNQVINRTCDKILDALRGAPVATNVVLSLEMGASLHDATATAAKAHGYPLKTLRAVARRAYAETLTDLRAERNVRDVIKFEDEALYEELVTKFMRFQRTHDTREPDQRVFAEENPDLCGTEDEQVPYEDPLEDELLYDTQEAWDVYEDIPFGADDLSPALMRRLDELM